MTTIVAQGTPLAEALSGVVQPKLVEMGWSSDGGEDSALTEYVILMLVNGKTQEQIAGELSNDLLGLGEGDTQALDFAKWLFEQVDILNRQVNGTGESGAEPASSEHAIQSFIDQGEAHSTATAGAGGDSEMGDAGDSIPTGPKAMRSNPPAGRGRMLNQINRTLDRGNESALHRVRGQGGSGRINSHGRDMRGNRQHQNGGRMNNRAMGGMGGMGMPGGPMAPNAAGNMMNMSPQDQMHLMALLEEQARMMAQLMPGMVPPAINPAFQQNTPQQGRSLFERVERQPNRSQGNFSKRPQQHRGPVQGPPMNDTDMDMTADHETKHGAAQENGNPSESVCHFNLRCTRKDCPYAHQSPAAPEGTAIDFNDVCPFGAACKNKKCTGRHPSPATKSAHQAEELCKFFPHCTNPHCSFKHPSMPLCRNGADCTTPGCKFTHLQTMCKFNPCLNRNCPYKHAEGQRGTFPDHVWTPGSAERKERSHVSERKFVMDEDAVEELIKPDSAPEGSQSQELAI